MITDPELEQWSELFRSQQQVEPAEIVARAKKAVRRFRLWVYTEIAVTLIATVFAICIHQRALTVLLAVSIAAAWLFRLLNDWNNFTGVATATGSYLNTLLRRLRSNKRAAEFGGVLYFVQLPIVSALVFRDLNIPLRAYLLLPANIFIACATVAFVIWLAVYRHNLKNQILELEKQQTEWEGPELILATPKNSLTISALLAQTLTNLERFRKKLRVF